MALTDARTLLPVGLSEEALPPFFPEAEHAGIGDSEPSVSELAVWRGADGWERVKRPPVPPHPSSRYRTAARELALKVQKEGFTSPDRSASTLA